MSPESLRPHHSVWQPDGRTCDCHTSITEPFMSFQTKQWPEVKWISPLWPALIVAWYEGLKKARMIACFQCFIHSFAGGWQRNHLQKEHSLNIPVKSSWPERSSDPLIPAQCCSWPRQEMGEGLVECAGRLAMSPPGPLTLKSRSAVNQLRLLFPFLLFCISL